ncbi:hypothetical protein FB451DRAFT_1218870 [Mycena latifolia]|nr:hypothetical protein FB451DRAFT_1218870 [Mycena latifolia]
MSLTSTKASIRPVARADFRSRLPQFFAMDSLIPFTTSGSLVDCVDRKMLVVLRDGRKLHGVLRSYDQFANLVLEDTENWHGLFLIRGENVDLDLEDEIPQRRQVEYAALEPYHKNDVEVKKQREEAKAQILYEQKGFCKEGGEGDGY